MGMTDWLAGLSRAVITPTTPVWLAGYGSKRVPEGTVHDLWVKVLAVADAGGRQGVMVTCDHMGVPRPMYERIRDEVGRRCGLKQSQLMLLFSHNHCGPVLRDDLVDFYPLDEQQRVLVGQYSDEVTELMVDAVVRALDDLRPARLSVGSGVTRFAVNRRDNPEQQVAARMARGEPLAGAVDHSVPVMAVRQPDGELRGVVFGYACHPTTMCFNQWCGDYPGFAQLAVERHHPGATAMFFTGCGADQNPLPRRELSLCRRYGRMLATAVEETLLQPMADVTGELHTELRRVDLPFDGVVSASSLSQHLESGNAIRVRWARRWLDVLSHEPQATLATSCPYPVAVWQLGAHLIVALGGEAVVDYALRLKRLYGPQTWVAGYANTLVAYIPSDRIYREGGYEGPDTVYEFGHAAERWAQGLESRIVDAVMEMVGRIRGTDCGGG